MTVKSNDTVQRIGAAAVKALDAQATAVTAGASSFEATAGSLLAVFITVRPNPDGGEKATAWMREMVDRLEAHHAGGNPEMLASMAKQTAATPIPQHASPSAGPANDRS